MKKQIVINLEESNSAIAEALSEDIRTMMSSSQPGVPFNICIRDIADEATLERARDEHWGKELEFDTDAATSPGEDPGMYIQAWAWLPDEANPVPHK